MKLIKILFSPTGGTKKIADIISKKIHSNSIDFLLTGACFTPDITIDSEDICIIAVPAFAGRVPIPAANRLAMLNGNGAKAILIASYGNRAFEDTLTELKDIAEKAHFNCIAAIAAVSEHSIMHQFGAGRPDHKDIEELKSYGDKIFELFRLNQTFLPVTVPGSHPYRDRGGLPLYPQASSSCYECGICADVCPVGAIDKTAPRKTNIDKCITCMSCVSACPQKARTLNPDMLSAASQKLKEACAGRKPNQIMIGE